MLIQFVLLANDNPFNIPNILRPITFDTQPPNLQIYAVLLQVSFVANARFAHAQLIHWRRRSLQAFRVSFVYRALVVCSFLLSLLTILYTKIGQTGVLLILKRTYHE